MHLGIPDLLTYPPAEMPGFGFSPATPTNGLSKIDGADVLAAHCLSALHCTFAMPEQILVPAVIAAVVPFVIWWMASGSPMVGQPGLLCYGRRARLFGVAITLLPMLLFTTLALVLPSREPGGAIQVLPLILFFAVVGGPLLIEFFRVSIRYNRDEIHVSSPWSRRRTLRWDQIRTVRWRPVMKWLALSDGERVVHISPLLTGLPLFAEACRPSLREGVFAQDHEASVALILMAQGRAGELIWSHGRPSQILSGTGR